MKKKMMRLCLTSFFVIGSLWILQRLLLPKYMSDVTEGALIAEYYEEEKNHDVIFIGDCEVYENFSPYILWKEYGINSYIRGSAQQLIWQSYYLLEETLKYEKPKVIVFNILAMQFDEPQKEEYNRMTLEGMRWSYSKLKSIQASMLEEESIWDYLFPILRYHSRWKELTKEDFQYLFDKDRISHNGYYMRVDVKAAGYVPEGKPLADYQFGDTAYAYLEKITSLCKENNIELVLVKAPSLYPYWYEEWEVQMAAYAREHGLLYLNFLDMQEDIGLDFLQDTYDGGLHLNLSGAEKLSSFFGKILVEEFSLNDRWEEEGLSAAWEEKEKAYKAEIELQMKKMEDEK